MYALKTVALAVSLALTFIWFGCLPRPIHEPRKSNGWAILQNRTAWLYLGDVTASEESWATQIRHADESGNTNRVVPQPGDVIRITSEIELLILEYRTRGEELRLRSPADRILTTKDRTGITLGSDSKVRIEEIQLETPAGGLKGVWARVTPVE